MTYQLQPIRPSGLDKDGPPSEQPENYWTDLQNFVFYAEDARRTPGEKKIYGTPLFPPQWGMPALAIQGALPYWLYAGGAGVAYTDGLTHVNLTPAGWTPTATFNEFTGGSLNLIPIVNSKDNKGWYWNILVQPVPSTLTALPGFPQGKCRILRPHKNFLIGLGWSMDSGEEYQDQVRWSTSAEPGKVPDTWTPQADNDAGDTLLTTEPGPIIDGVALGDNFLVYKEYAIYSMQYIGGQYVFATRQVRSGAGCAALGCITELQGRHLVFGNGDLYLYDGIEPVSVLDRRLRIWLQNNINASETARCLVHQHYETGHVVFAFPSAGSQVCDLAIVWDYRAGIGEGLSVRELPKIDHMARGQSGEQQEDPTWDADSGQWDADNSRWNQSPFDPSLDGTVMFSSAENAILGLGLGEKFYRNGAEVDITAYAERLGLELGHPTRRKQVRAIWPTIDTPNAQTIYVRAGHSDARYSPVQWGPETAVQIAPSSNAPAMRVPVEATGRMIAVSFRSEGGNGFTLSGFDVEYRMAGRV